MRFAKNYSDFYLVRHVHTFIDTLITSPYTAGKRGRYAREPNDLERDLWHILKWYYKQ